MSNRLNPYSTFSSVNVIIRLMMDYSGADELAERLGQFARASWLKGELKLARTAIRKSLILRPANAAIAGNLGSLESEAHHVISKMRWGQIIDPTNLGVLHNLALAYARVGDCSNALSACCGCCCAPCRAFC